MQMFSVLQILALQILTLQISICKIEAYTLYSGLLIENLNFTIDYNFTIGQANYALYQPSFAVSNGSCWNRWRNGYNYTWKDYNGFQTSYGIDRGHLATFASLGIRSCTMNNIVPMNHSFNAGVWKNVEIQLRKKYAAHWVAAGCLYRSDYHVIHNGKMFYLTDGCYYIVFSQNPLSGSAGIIKNGYVSSDGMVANSDLPWWVMGQTDHVQTDHALPEPVVFLLIWIGAVVVMIAAAVVIITLPYPSRQYME